MSVPSGFVDMYETKDLQSHPSPTSVNSLATIALQYSSTRHNASVETRIRKEGSLHHQPFYSKLPLCHSLG